jgi:hypothetical protein
MSAKRALSERFVDLLSYTLGQRCPLCIPPSEDRFFKLPTLIKAMAFQKWYGWRRKVFAAVGLECGWSCTSIVIFHKMLPHAAKTRIRGQAVQLDTALKWLR